MKVSEVRAHLADANGDDWVVVWKDGMRISGGTRREISANGCAPESVAQEIPEIPEPHLYPIQRKQSPVRVVALKVINWHGAEWVVSATRSPNGPRVAHLFKPEVTQIRYQLNTESGLWVGGWVHFGTHCNTPVYLDLHPSNPNLRKQMLFVDFPDGFRVCKNCAKKADLKVCQYCGILLTSRQRKWCSAHSSAHMRTENS